MQLYMKWLLLIFIYIYIYIYIYIFKFPLIFNQQEIPYYSSIEDDIISYIGGYIIRKLSLNYVLFAVGF